MPLNPNFIVEPCTADDIPEITRIQFAAFTDPFQYEPYHEVLYPGGNTAAARAAASVRILADFQADSHAQYLKVVDTATGKIAAGCRWAVYHHNKMDGGEGIEADWVDIEDPKKRLRADWGQDWKDYTEHILRGLYSNRDSVTKGAPFVVLDMLYVDPEYQRQGAGQLLMNWGVAKADELGYLSIIESTRSAKPLYERNGYVAERTYIAVPEKWLWRTPVQYWIMHRPARTLNGVNGAKTNGVNGAKTNGVNGTNGVVNGANGVVNGANGVH